jgi:hypothetical protein
LLEETNKIGVSNTAVELMTKGTKNSRQLEMIESLEQP